jgi:hypothetical protein
MSYILQIYLQTQKANGLNSDEKFSTACFLSVCTKTGLCTLAAGIMALSVHFT